MEEKKFKKKKKIDPKVMMLILTAVLVGVFLVSFVLGRYDVSVGQVMGIIADRIVEAVSFGNWHIPKTWTQAMEIAVINIRLPRILMAILVGCCLAAAGASYQGVFQNPMASPDVLGASSGAAFGAALAILLGVNAKLVVLFAFAAGIITVLIVFLIARKAPGMRVVNLVLAGIMISSLFSAGTSYIKLVADPSNQLPAITYWLMGSLSGVKLSDVAFQLIPMAIGCAALLLVRWRINLLTLGDEEAHTLGVNTDLLRLVVIIASTLITAASISAAGMIGWVGLVIPHLTRKLVGTDYKYLMPASMITGAAFLLIVDNISRNLLEVEIPIGILTAFVGAPFFIYLIMKKEKTL